MARYLGIDYGEKRIGLAVSDEEGKMAFPKEVMSADWASMRKFFGEIFKKEKFKAVIVGLPITFSMKESRQSQKVRSFASWLEKEFGVKVVFENEILSTKEAEKSGGSSKEMIDASSAALILQSFLNRLK